MRTIKTGIAVALCMIFFHYTNRGTPALAALAAVFSLREDWRTSFNFGKTRIFGNSVGALLATALVLFQQLQVIHFFSKSLAFLLDKCLLSLSVIS
ncbi:aromatic acid exporter family protein [Carnobacterium funditum]|uniref:aromatic acid exporter family protein n=1 Tax=Carnobacterium funditum TaxID=2752 RepID=UPI000B0026C1|nr:aromatic acid exporter family protein [Carnobacterium funditum]